MEWTAHTRGTARTVAAAGAALVAGGVAAVRTVHASAPTPTGPVPAALPDGIRRIEPGPVSDLRSTASAARRRGAGRSPRQPG